MPVHPKSRLAKVLYAASLAAAGSGLDGCGPAPSPAPPAFVGSASCGECHAGEYAAWAGSQHAQAMQEADATTVLGPFAGETFTAGGVTSRFSRRDGRFLVETDGGDGQRAEFEATHSFGRFPLQQYLLPLPGGRLQSLGIAWDARPADAGGQRWFHLYPGQEPRPGDPLHWSGIDQNWNYQCADCHSTNLRKNYDAATRTYATTWSEISVGCEACHGPASNHLAWARRLGGWRALDADRGLVHALDERRGVGWRTGAGPTATRSVPREGSREIDTCARCHARRGQFSDATHAGEPWLDAFRPALIEPGLYHADGQQREEVYTWGSFLQSRMHAAGVTCADCHDPHSQRLRAPGNAVCAQCHAVATFDAATHHHHAPGSAATRCTTCHMPATTYMVVDPRHDHSLRIPRPDLSVTLGTPNACGDCHGERGAQWAADAIAAWSPRRKPGFQSFAATFAAADRGDPAVAVDLARLIVDPAQPALVRASAIARGMRLDTPALTEPVGTALADADALVRATAAEALAAIEPTLRAERLAPLLADPVRLVRMAAVRALAGEAEARLVGEEAKRFTAALAEWTAAQRFNADRPEAHLNLGALHLERGDPQSAIVAFREALALDPGFVQAAINLADARRAVGDETGAEATLREALARDPQAAIAHHALGLSLVRQGRKTEALEALGRAHEFAPGDARLAYVYAVARHDSGDAAGARATLRDALRSHPYDRDLLAALRDYGDGSPDPVPPAHRNETRDKRDK